MPLFSHCSEKSVTQARSAWNREKPLPLRRQVSSLSKKKSKLRGSGFVRGENPGNSCIIYLRITLGLHRLDNSTDHTIYVLYHVVIPETDHLISYGLKVFCSSLVIFMLI